MSLSKTYYADGDYAYPDVSSALLIAQSFIWALKALLAGQVSGTHGTNGAPPAGSKWTVLKSSDGSSSASSDLWGSTFDASKLVRDTAGNPHSWVLLQSPSALGPTYLLIDWGTSSDSTVNIYWSRTAYSGGTVSARPTCSNEEGYTGWTIPDLTVAGSHRISRITDANGMFHILCARGGAGIFNTWFGFTRLSETVSGDSYTEASLLEATTSGRGAGSNASSTLNNKTASSGVGMRSYNNAYATDTGASSGFMLMSSGQLLRSVVNPANSKVDGWPLYVQGTYNSAALAAIRGKWPDLENVNSAKNVGDLTPVSSADRILVGNVLVPCDGVALSV